MYEEYMQNFYNYPMNGYRNTYDQMADNYQYSYNNQNMSENNYVPYSYMQNRNHMQTNNLEEYYPEIYKIVYPMVQKVCTQNNRGTSKEVIDKMVDEVYRNVETNGMELNITLNNDVRGEEKSETTEANGENRQIKNNSLNDLIRILILRELIGKPRCMGGNCRPGQRPNPWMGSPFPMQGQFV